MDVSMAVMFERILSRLISYSGIGSVYRPNKNKALILTYHSIRDDNPGSRDRNALCIVSRSNFERHLKYLKSMYKIVPVKEIAECIMKGKNPPGNCVAITFDDGYRDNLTNAYPVLKRHGCPATIFLCTGRMGKDGYLSWKDAEKMDELVEFGAHTLSHPKLTEIDARDARREIVDSKKLIEKKLKRRVSVFAYPYGDFNGKVKNVVKEAGFSCAVSCISGGNDKNTGIFELRRIGVTHENDLTAFKVKINGSLDHFLNLFNRFMKLSVY
jgi:peptidoglycan/xylan/chitin deacetylase (PgdA/CDA1 family)